MRAEEKMTIPAEWFDPLEKNVLADLGQIMSKWADQIFGVIAIIIHKGKRRAGLVLAPAGLVTDDWTPPKGTRCLGATCS